MPLSSIDKDQNGEIDLVELCEVLEELETSNRSRRLLKWVAIVTALFSLLTIAAIVGLTYAVVDLSKETTVSNQSLVSKDTGDTLATAKAKQSVGLGSLVSATPQELVDLESVILPMNNNRTQIMHVSDLELDPGVSLTLTSVSGKSIIIAADGSVSDMNFNATFPGGGSRRRLLDDGTPPGGGGGQGIMAESNGIRQHSTCYWDNFIVANTGGLKRFNSDRKSIRNEFLRDPKVRQFTDVPLFQYTMNADWTDSSCQDRPPLKRKASMKWATVKGKKSSWQPDYFARNPVLLGINPIATNPGPNNDRISHYGFYVKTSAGVTVMDDRMETNASKPNLGFYSPVCLFNRYEREGLCTTPLSSRTNYKVHVSPGPGSEQDVTVGETYEFGMRMTIWTDNEIVVSWPEVQLIKCCSYY